MGFGPVAVLHDVGAEDDEPVGPDGVGGRGEGAEAGEARERERERSLFHEGAEDLLAEADPEGSLAEAGGGGGGGGGVLGGCGEIQGGGSGSWGFVSRGVVGRCRRFGWTRKGEAGRAVWQVGHCWDLGLDENVYDA